MNSEADVSDTPVATTEMPDVITSASTANSSGCIDLARRGWKYAATRQPNSSGR